MPPFPGNFFLQIQFGLVFICHVCMAKGKKIYFFVDETRGKQSGCVSFLCFFCKIGGKKLRETRIEFEKPPSAMQTNTLDVECVRDAALPLRLMTNSRNERYLHLLPSRGTAEAISDRFILFSFRVNSLLTAAEGRAWVPPFEDPNSAKSCSPHWNQRKLSSDQVESHQSLFWNQRRYFVTVQSGFCVRAVRVWLRRDQPHLSG